MPPHWFWFVGHSGQAVAIVTVTGSVGTVHPH
jgi:hypothetical protein